MGRDVFHLMRLPKAPSNLTLDDFRALMLLLGWSSAPGGRGTLVWGAGLPPEPVLMVFTRVFLQAEKLSVLQPAARAPCPARRPELGFLTTSAPGKTSSSRLKPQLPPSSTWGLRLLRGAAHLHLSMILRVPSNRDYS